MSAFNPKQTLLGVARNPTKVLTILGNAGPKFSNCELSDLSGFENNFNRLMARVVDLNPRWA